MSNANEGRCDLCCCEGYSPGELTTARLSRKKVKLCPSCLATVQDKSVLIYVGTQLEQATREGAQK